MAFSKSETASEHIGTLLKARLRRYEIDPSALIKNQDLTEAVRSLNRIAIRQEPESQSEAVIPMISGFLQTWHVMRAAIPQRVINPERADLLLDVASSVFWLCYARCDFNLVKKTTSG